MTMRSMPPASSHLAERPVPAPPPTMGSPRAIFARRRLRISVRGMWAMAGLSWRSACSTRGRTRRLDLAPGGDERVGEGLVVDVQGQAAELALRRRPELLL